MNKKGNKCFYQHLKYKKDNFPNIEMDREKKYRTNICDVTAKFKDIT